MTLSDAISLPTTEGLVKNCLDRCEGRCPTGDFVRWANEGGASEGDIVQCLFSSIKAQKLESDPLAVNNRQIAQEKIFETHVDNVDVDGVIFDLDTIEKIGTGALTCLSNPNFVFNI